jgi:hypothetical protein
MLLHYHPSIRENESESEGAFSAVVVYMVNRSGDGAGLLQGGGGAPRTCYEHEMVLFSYPTGIMAGRLDLG